MNLNELLGKRIEKITPHHATIKRLLAAAERNITDSKVTMVSPENRFDAAYKAIMQIANAATSKWVQNINEQARPSLHYDSCFITDDGDG